MEEEAAGGQGKDRREEWMKEEAMEGRDSGMYEAWLVLRGKSRWRKRRRECEERLPGKRGWEEEAAEGRGKG